MSVILAECKFVVVVAGVLAVALATAQWRQAMEAPIYLPAEDPCMFDRVCASACNGPADDAVTATLDSFVDPVDAPH